MKKNLKKIYFCLVGVICIGLSIRCFTFPKSLNEGKKLYGANEYEAVVHPNAYTGIQNAIVDTADNVSELKEFEKFGFGSALLVTGLILLGGQLPKEIPEEKKVENPFDDNVELLK